MKTILKLEIYKAFKNKLFIVSIGIGCAITILSLLNVLNYSQTYQLISEEIDITTTNPQVEANTLFNNWIGGEPCSLGTALFFFIFPILVALPYGWSYCEEKKSGYIRTMVVRIGKKEYFIAKYVAVFLTGGCAMIIPLLFNFVLTAMLVPAVTPLVNYDVYYAVFGESLMSTLYYTEPFLYIFLYLCIDFVYGGLLAGICFTASIVLKQKWSVVLSPFFVCMVIHFMRRFIYISSMTIYKEISPIFFLRPARAAYDADKWIMLGMALIIFIITFFVNISRERKHEIY